MDSIQKKNLAHLIFCLSIDLIGSTKAGLRKTSSQLERFNLALIQQIEPHLTGLDLKDIVIKFTGDGWLLLSEEEKVPALCCFAIIMSYKFQEEMAKLTSTKTNHIPKLRIAICSSPMP